jgi:hypothetical protein
MPLLAASDAPIANAYACASVMGEHELPFRQYFETDIAKSVLTEIRAGNTTYPLRYPCEATFLPGIGELRVDGFSPMFIGRGATPRDAQQNWSLAVHAAFQELCHKRPFEMTPRDSDLWSLLSSNIDVTVYRNRTPVQVRQFGRIQRARPYPELIVWEDGSADCISLNQVESDDFVTFPVGQPVEAIVARDPITFELVRIVYIQRRNLAGRLPADEEDALLDSIGSTKRLPIVSWK